MRLVALALILLLPLAHGVSYSSIEVQPHTLVILSAEGGEAVAIVYEVWNEGALAAFVSSTTLVRDGAELPNGDLMALEFEEEALRQVRAGGEPGRDAWVELNVSGNTGGLQITQKVYSTPEGYEATFTPALPVSLAGRRVWIEHANNWWLVGEISSANRSLLLYREAAYGRIGQGSELTYGEFGLSFIGVQEGRALVRFRAGNEKTTLAVRELDDPQQQRLILWVDYNSSQGIVENATCYLEGDIKGSLSFINGRYKGQLDYESLPERIYSYAVSCSKEGYDPKTLSRVLNLTSPAPPQPPAAPPAMPEITAQPYQPAESAPTIFDWLNDLLYNAFWWLG